MRSALMPVVAFALGLLPSSRSVADDYQTEGGQLTERLTLVQSQGGFAGTTGIQYTIAKDGSWTSESVMNEKRTPKEKGKLTQADLAKLAGTLKEFDLVTLPPRSGKQPGANPHTISIVYGKTRASFTGQRPPRLDHKNPAGSPASRMAGIWKGVTDLLKAQPPAKKQAP